MAGICDHHVYTDRPGTTTEWEDTLIAHGIIAEKEEHVALREAARAEEAAVAAARDARDNFDPLAGKSLAELDAVHNGDLDDGDDADASAGDDRASLEAYRAKRLAELRARREAVRQGADGASGGGVYRLIGRGDFVREVTEASAKGPTWVVLHLCTQGDDNPECAALHTAFAELAERHPAARFLRIVGTHCIEGYPDENLPTVIVYHDGECQLQIVGGKRFGGRGATADRVEWVLAEVGAVETEQVDDPREQQALGFQVKRSPPRKRNMRGGGTGGRSVGAHAKAGFSAAFVRAGGEDADSSEDDY